MKRVVFKNRIFYGLLLAYMIAFLLYNLYVTLFQGNLYGIIPVSIEVALLITILTKNANAKVFIQIWVIIFLLVGPVSGIIVSLSDGFASIKSNSFIFELFQFGIGLLILDYTKRTVVIVFSSLTSGDNLQDNDSPNFDRDLKQKNNSTSKDGTI